MTDIRRARPRPLLDHLHGWLNKTLAGLSWKSDTTLAIRYTGSRWRALSRYIDDGRIEIDNSQLNALCTPSFSVARTTCVQARALAANVLPLSTLCAVPQA